jgi:hypothetical protein
MKHSTELRLVMQSDVVLTGMLLDPEVLPGVTTMA